MIKKSIRKKYNYLIEEINQNELEIKNYKSRKKKKKHDKILPLAKSKALIHSTISHTEVVLINNVPNIFHYMKKEIEKSNDK